MKPIPMPLIAKPSPRKQELLNKFFWFRTFLLIADHVGFARAIDYDPELATAEDVDAHRNTYLIAEDDDFFFNYYSQVFQDIENDYFRAGLDVDAALKATMKRNGYKDFTQMQSNNSKKIMAAIKVFDDPAPEPIFTGQGKDPWDL
jgi:hypothetical protein